MVTRYDVISNRLSSHFWVKIFWVKPAAYDVISLTIETGHHWTCLKMRTRDKQTASQNVRCWCLILWEKNSEKPQRGVASTHPPLYVRGLFTNLLLKSLGYARGERWEGKGLFNLFSSPISPSLHPLRQRARSSLPRQMVMMRNDWGRIRSVRSRAYWSRSTKDPAYPHWFVFVVLPSQVFQICSLI